MRILGVDDDEMLLELASEFFEDLGHEFHGCKSQLEAQPLLGQYRFDAALVDYHIGAGTGRLLIGTVLRDYPGTQVIVITGDYDPDIRNAVERMGVKHVLYKPFRFKQLLDLLDEGRTGSHTGPRLTIYGGVQDDELEALKRVLMDDPANLEAKWLLAFTYYKANKFADAAHLLKQLLDQQPDNKLALYYVAACEYRLGFYEDAVESWTRVAKVDEGGSLGKKVREHMERALALIGDD